MNLLQLCQNAMLECGVAGTLLQTSGATGGQGRIVSWVADAWQELQTKHDNWDFMRSSNILGAGASFVTVAGTAVYPLGTGSGTCGITADEFGMWDQYTFRSYLTSVGTQDEMILDAIGFDDFRDAYMLGNLRTVQTRPICVAIGTNQAVCVGPPSNGLYTVTGDYFMAPTTMDSDSDTPTGLPAQFHKAIVFKVMEYYGGYEAAPEVLDRGTAGYARLTQRLGNLNLPNLTWAGALA